ncbi:MAG TPA: hypothetical protein VJT67_18185 [Longimicrobiaceae bacterium]|nr:hypothetical protein [Longimicrobiaceae bacterium]
MANEAASCCPRCAGDRPMWRIQRNRAAPRDSRRTLLWSCRACGHEWAEPLSVTFERAREAEPAG